MSSDRFSLNGSAPKKQSPDLAERDRQAELKLSARYDALNQLFAETEQRLKALKPVHPVWVDYDHGSSESGTEYWELLGLVKHQDKWRLCHAYDNEQNDDGSLYECKPIVECAVDVRVRAAEVVRRLHEKIVKSKEDYVPRVDAAIKQLTDMCKEL